MPSPNLRQYSDNAFLPRDMKCLGYDAHKNCYVFRKKNEIWLGIFGQRWDGARLVRFGNILQSTLDEGALDDLSAVPEYPPDYMEDPESTPRLTVTNPGANRLSSSSWSPATPTTELSSVRASPGSPSTSDEAEVVASQWGVASTSITAAGVDNQNRLRQRASHIITSMIPHPHLHLHQHKRNSTS